MATKWARLSDITPDKMTPMLRQYLQAKAESGDSLLFFRMGDFYELFFEDAIEASEILGLTLTSRDGANKGDRVPMAGVPVRAVDGYVARLIKAGRTVTICEQVEDPKEAKGVVKRSVVRTVTPGTVMEPDLLEETSNNYLAALRIEDDRAGLAFVDVTTGEFLAAQIDTDVERTLVDELTRMAPVEVLVPASFEGGLEEGLRRRFAGVAFTTCPDDAFDREAADERVREEFGLSTLKGVGLHDAPQALESVGAALDYIKRTQRDTVPHLRLPRRYSPGNYVVLDGNTQRNLELVESLADKKRRGTLLSVLDRTLTSMGARKIRHWILHPLVDVHEIQERLDAVDELFNDAARRLELREALRGVADLERLLGRITARTGNARDVKALGASLERVPGLRAALAGAQSSLLASLRDGLDEL